MRCYLSTSRCALAAIALLVLLANGSPAAGNESKNTSDAVVYYESLCGDSINWFKEVLKPSYENIKGYLNITFVPYGKASQRRDPQTGQWVFSCQHGAAECDGNLAQSCGIHVIKNEESPEKVQDLTVALLICAMTSKYPPTAVPKCAERVGLSQKSQRKIGECISSPLGNDLLAANGDKTTALSPPLTYVPWVTINGVIDWYGQQSRVNGDFSKLICEQLREGAKPSLCSA